LQAEITEGTFSSEKHYFTINFEDQCQGAKIEDEPISFPDVDYKVDANESYTTF